MLKPVKRGQSITVISPSDPAIDRDNSPKREGDDGKEKLAYALDLTDGKFGGWSEKLRFHAGEQPTKFLVGVIPSAEMNLIQDECLSEEGTKFNELCWRSFCSSIRDIENFGGDMKIPKHKVDGIDYVSPAWLRRTFIGDLRDVAITIGFVAWQWNSLQETDIKN